MDKKIGVLFVMLITGSVLASAGLGQNEINNVQTSERLNMKIMGVLNAQQQQDVLNLLQQILNDSSNSTIRIQVDAKNGFSSDLQTMINELMSKLNNTDNAKISLGQHEHKSENETDEESHNQTNATQILQERATERLNQAKKYFNELNSTSSNETLIKKIQKHITAADTALSESKFGQAFGQATAALKQARHALNLINGGD